jgi:hypothetical protein
MRLPSMEVNVLVRSTIRQTLPECSRPDNDFDHAGTKLTEGVRRRTDIAVLAFTATLEILTVYRSYDAELADARVCEMDSGSRLPHAYDLRHPG